LTGGRNLERSLRPSGLRDDRVVEAAIMRNLRGFSNNTFSEEKYAIREKI
jgi:hypothetical protein